MWQLAPVYPILTFLRKCQGEMKELQGYKQYWIV